MVSAAILDNEVDRTQAQGDGSWFLSYFVHRLLDFRLPDVEAVAEMVGCPPSSMKWQRPHGNEDLSPFW
jgi:tRNA (guanine10-N2)-methyltransferase